jgi:predicted alpha/beta-hydrolase family hydrolase
MNITIPVGQEHVSGSLLRPSDAKALYLFAHGAGAGMTHKTMVSNAEGLARRGIAHAALPVLVYGTW